MASCKESKIYSSTLNICLSSLKISETKETLDKSDTSCVDQEQDDDEELKELLQRMKAKARASYPEPDYCFQTDPVWAPGEERPGPEPDPDKRVNNVTWCKCHNCSPRNSVTESVCCCELEVLEHLVTGNLTCVSEHVEFQSRCLDQETLVTCMISQTMPYRRAIDYNKPNCLRLAAYRQFTTWIYAYLRKYVQIPIPSCVIRTIREKFPDPEGRYTGFRYYQDVPLSSADFDFNF
ncbi:P2X purinoceptor 7-like [Bufo bufo]|uniref:P2X purinoceptor 7-like n=1 Tax=Bufo bufo TaxID=8384 RepID=UPI001ABDC59A|nr:P2X purinoceptor 7-like [Bufo bufo]